MSCAATAKRAPKPPDGPALRQRPTVRLYSSGWAGKRVGLLGGSFNPAHRGHFLISKLALHRLDLDAVWWLVSPQNPLKQSADMVGLDERVRGAQVEARLPQIRVSSLESTFGTTYTIDTLRELRRHFPKTGFVWMMGADNLLQMPRWKDWQNIFHTMPIAIFGRPSYSLAAMNSPAAKRFARHRIPANTAPTLARRPAPAWCFLQEMTDPISATQIRGQSNGAAKRS